MNNKSIFLEFINESQNYRIITGVIDEDLTGYYLKLLSKEELLSSELDEFTRLSEETYYEMINNVFSNPKFYQEYLWFIKSQNSSYYLWVEELFVLSQISGKTIQMWTWNPKEKKEDKYYLFKPDIKNIPLKWDRSKYAKLFKDDKAIDVFHNGIDHYERYLPAPITSEKVLIPPQSFFNFRDSRPGIITIPGSQKGSAIGSLDFKSSDT